MFVGAGSKIGLIGRIGRIGVAGKDGSDISDKSDDSDGVGRGRTGSDKSGAFHGRLIMGCSRGLSIKLFFLTKPH